MLCAIVLISKLSANCDVYDSYESAMSDNLLIKRECESLLGGGGTYHSDLIEANKSARVSCDGIIREEGFVLVFGCNTCTSKNIQERLKQDTIACTKQCRMTRNNCVYDGISNDWGGYYNTDQHPSCSPLKSTSLPGCAESSSSVGEDEQSSSSEAPVSSEAESSSSEEDVESSSSEEEIDSSSSEDDDDESSSSSEGEDCGTGTGHCPSKVDSLGPNLRYDEIDCSYSRTPSWRILEGEGECVTKHIPESNRIRRLFTRNIDITPTLDPRDFDKIAFEFRCDQSKYYNDGFYHHLWIKSNVPYAIEGSIFTDYYCYKTLNDCLLGENKILMAHPFGYRCGPLGSTLTDYGCSIIHPYDGQKIATGMEFYYTNEKGFSISDDFRFRGTMLSNLTEGFLYNAIRKAAQNAEMTIIKNGTSVYPNIEAMDDVCAEWQNRGGRNRSSSSKMESSSSWNVSSSSLQVEISSSNNETESSSSMENVSSSSVNDEWSSSSNFVESSSSVYVESSSSDFVYSSSDDGVFVAGGDQEYTSDQIFKDGLDNMEKGKCYSLNPARGTQHGWINTNAQDSWWWREVDCKTGDKVDNNRVVSGVPAGQCAE